MPFSVPSFLVLDRLADQQGVTDQAARQRIALVGGVVGFTSLGIILGKSLIDREVQSATPPVITDPVTTPVVFPVPDVVKADFKDAQQTLTAEPHKFTVKRVNLVDRASKAKDEEVVKQEPAAGESRATGETVTVTVHVVEKTGVVANQLQDAVERLVQVVEGLKSAPKN